jgi:hypothetical protein
LAVSVNASDEKGTCNMGVIMLYSFQNRCVTEASGRVWPWGVPRSRTSRRFSGPSVLRLRCETKGPVNALYRELDSTPRVVNCVWPNRKNRKGE